MPSARPSSLLRPRVPVPAWWRRAQGGQVGGASCGRPRSLPPALGALGLCWLSTTKVPGLRALSTPCYRLLLRGPRLPGVGVSRNPQPRASGQRPSVALCLRGESASSRLKCMVGPGLGIRASRSIVSDMFPRGLRSPAPSAAAPGPCGVLPPPRVALASVSGAPCWRGQVASVVPGQRHLGTF